MYKNLTVRELYASCETAVVDELFQKGLEINNDRLAITAMKELICRGDIDAMVKSLDRAFDQEQMVQGGYFVLMIGAILFNDALEVAPILHEYGQGLLQGEFMGPSEWMRAHIEQFGKVY